MESNSVLDATWALASKSHQGVATFVPILAAIAVWLVTVIVYRIFFHPLRSHPGPLIAKLTTLYTTFHVVKKDEARNLHELHEKYGPVVRYGPNHISHRSPEAVRLLYVNSTYTRKSDFYRAFPRSPEETSLFSSIRKDVHARKRRIFRYGFSDSALKEAEVTVKQHVNMLCRSLEHLEDDNGEGRTVANKESTGKWSTPKNYSIWINRYSFDLSSGLSLSRSFDMMASSTYRDVPEVITTNLWADNVTGSSLALLHSLNLRWPLLSKWVPSRQPFDDFVEESAMTRVRERAEGSDEHKKDFFFWLTNKIDAENGEEYPMEELKEEVILLITGGGDTSSTTISAAMYYLLHNPSKLKRLQEEIRRVFPKLEDISFASGISGCVYLRACIDEALRMAPPAGSVLHRQVEPCGVAVGDFFYPPDTHIGVPVYALHHDPLYFPEPFKYQPERWIPGETLADGTEVTADMVKRATSAFLPFSAGTRGCIGKPLAYMHMQVLYATLMWGYEFRLCQDRWVNGTRSGLGPDPTEEYELRDVFTSWKNGPLIEMKRRE